MPKVTYDGRVIECAKGAVLEEALSGHGPSLHNGITKHLNCHGRGTCGTCAVEASGALSAKGWRERLRTMLPPLRGRDLRLSCQARVLGDVAVVKHPGLWGQRTTRREAR